MLTQMNHLIFIPFLCTLLFACGGGNSGGGSIGGDRSQTNDGQANAVWLNNGTDSFTNTSQTLGNSTPTHSITLGDIDGDGDLVVGNRSEVNTVWRNDGAGNFTDTNQTLGSARTTSVILGYIDGDGDLGLVAGNDG
ncbi:hypothetical protein MNBD_GAMMA23-1937 [hydrothermal vent metagenome]|uniref:VCBS repeat-containing protein n=1 Tax=hydrothermal vent metagenome TaxID=652676 RepID=A0A3B1B2V6_9ZZZZ